MNKAEVLLLILVKVMCKFINSRHDVKDQLTYHIIGIKKKVWEKSIKFSDKNASSTNFFWQNVDVNNDKDETKKIKFLNILTHKYLRILSF